MENVIAIVGGGATALGFIHHYIDRLEENDALPRTIYLFEKQKIFGPGAAYMPDVASNLLNTQTGFITPFVNRPGDFQSWLNEKESSWRTHFPHFEADPHSYAPRPLFGLYLQDRLAWTIGLAAAKGILIVQINAEVKDVGRSGDGYVIKTDGSLRLKADHIFMMCGTLPEKVPEAQRKNHRVLAHPYPISDLPRKIPSASRVAIIGARLSCIDAVIGLVESGHRGHIAIYSRSGYFPSVRGTQSRITPRHLNAEGIDAHVATKGSLSLQDLVHLVRSEIADVSGSSLDSIPSLLTPPLPPACVVSFLRDEIEAAHHARVWQAVLYSTNAIIERIWQALSEKDRISFLQRYMSAFMAYRVSIPVENAKKILRYLESGQVSFHKGKFDLIIGPDDRPELASVDSKLSARRYDYVINAKGSPRSVKDADSDLLSNLLCRGEVAPDPLGGIRIDPDTYEVIDASGVHSPSMHVVGELTTGAFFFTSALDINARHARVCVESFINVFRRSKVETNRRFGRALIDNVA